MIKEVLHRAGLRDLDRLASRLSRAIDAEIASGVSLDDAVRRATQETQTSTFSGSQSRQLTKNDFHQRIGAELRRVQITATERTITDSLLAFSEFAESQLARDFKADHSERFLRSHILAWLTRDGAVIREAHEGAGQTDVVAVDRRTGARNLVEAKVPDTKTVFDDGLTETAQYAKTMLSTRAFYVAVDHCTDLDRPRFMQQAHEVFVADGIDVCAIRIRVPANSPSQVGRARRRAASAS